MKSRSIVALILLSLIMVAGKAAVSAPASATSRSEPMRLIPPLGHTRFVSDIQASRDGRWAASCSWDGSAILWETATGRVLRRFPLTAKGHRVRFLEKLRSLLTVETNNRIVLWDLETGRPRWEIQAPLQIESISVRPDGQRFAAAGTDLTTAEAAKTIVYAAETGAVVQAFGAASEISLAGVTEVLYSHDGGNLYGFSRHQFLRYQNSRDAPPNALLAFEAASGMRRKAFSGTGTAIAFSKDAKFLLTQDQEGISWRNALSGAVVRAFRKEVTEGSRPAAIALSPDSSRFATVTGSATSSDATIREYSVATGDILHKTTVNGVGAEPSLVYLPDSTTTGNHGVLVTLNAGQKPFCQVNIAGKTVIRTFQGGSGLFHTPSALSPDGKTIFLPNGTQTGIIGWDATKRTRTNLFPFPSDKADKNASPPLVKPVVSRDGRILVTPGVSDTHVFVSDLRAGTVLADIPVTVNGLSAGIGIAPAGDWIAVSVGGVNYRDSVQLFSRTGTLLREIHPPTIGNNPLFIRAVASDGTGKRVFISDYSGRLFVYEVDSGKLLRTLPTMDEASRQSISSIVPMGTDQDRLLLVRDSGQVAEIDLSAGESTAKSLGEIGEGKCVAAVSPDGHQVALGRADGAIVLRESVTGTVKTLIGHTGPITALAFSPGGRQLTSLGNDGMVRFWETNTGTEQISLLVYSRKPSNLAAFFLDRSQVFREDLQADLPQWIAFNRNGLFEGAPAATGQIHFARGTQSYSADQFFEQFYHSGLLASVVSNGNGTDAPKPSHDILDSLRIGTPPLVKIVSPPVEGKTVSSATVTLRVEATEQGGGGVGAIRLYQNGRLIGGPSRLRGIAVEAASGATTTKSFTVSLASGENTFRAVAYSKSDLESVPATLTVTYQVAQIVKPNLYVLAVGINTYKDSTMNLAYARPDAEALAAFFEKTARSPESLFHRVVVSRLMDAEATGAAIAEKLSDLAATAKPDDVVFLYFAGHGETVDNAWYFLPHEMRQMALTERVKDLGIPWAKIETAVGKITARKVVLVVDACKSGAALTGALRGVDEESQAMAIMARAQGIHILTASTAQQYAAEVKELGHGILTYALLEGLNGKATSADGVFVRPLLSYVEDRVPELSRQYRGSEQYPVPFERGQNFPLVGK